MRFVSAILAMLFAFSATAAPKSLSRAEAIKVIERNAKFSPLSAIPMSLGAFRMGLNDGSWVLVGQKFKLAKGLEAHFTGIAPNNHVWAKVPLKRKIVEVTGITEDWPNTRTVLFTWRFTNLSETVAKYTGLNTANHSSKAYLKLYDDGWRVERLDDEDDIFSGGNQANDEGVARETMSRIETIGLAWQMFDLDTGSFWRGPTKDGVIDPKALDKQLSLIYTRSFHAEDLWGRPMIFRVRDGGKRFEIRSLGSDGKADNAGGSTDRFAKDIVYGYDGWESKPEGVTPK